MSSERTGPPDWDAVPDPPDTLDIEEAQIRREYRLALGVPLKESKFDFDQVIRCAEDVWCPTCAVLRQEGIR